MMKAKMMLLVLVSALSWSGAALGQSCDGICGDYTGGVCNCDSLCWDLGDCCDDICDFCEADYTAQCNCVPDCAGKVCGSDGCFGSCGDCDPGFGCNAGVCEEGFCEDEGDVPDCNGECYPGTWIGDGDCDEGQWGAVFNCEATGWDGGDCPLPCTPDNTCLDLGVECGPHPECPETETCGDCESGYYCDAGACIENPCEDPTDMPGCFGVCELISWLGDGYCDANFNCEEMNWDNGDCEPCVPDCTGLDCGVDPTCNMLCGVCADAEFCTDDGLCQACQCAAGQECGVDECGNPCGECAEDWFCNDDLLCEECLCEAGWECGVADCGTSCGECADGFGCIDHLCVEQTCAGSCGGAGIGGCYCDASCFGFGDCCPDVCDECPDEDAEMCACVPDCDGKDCGFDGCWGTCGTCADGSFCTEDGLCEVCECGDKECGDDGCGNPCGDNEGLCPDGACYDGLCWDGDGCTESADPGCGGCGCEDCVGAMDPYCIETAWDSTCVATCLLLCGGCGDQAGCGDGVCEFPENCNTCADDCGCPGGLTCSFDQDLEEFECVEGSCDEGMEMGCCDGDVLNICFPGLGFQSFDCTEDGNVCGWFVGDDNNDPRYYCGTEDQLVDEDPDGTYPALCGDFTCTPDCTDLECGLDPLCGTECGPCTGDDTCEDGVCVSPCTPDCTDAACGDDDGCGGLCDGDCPDGQVCNEGVCEDCVPECGDLECGPDPICGVECGPCPEGSICTDDQLCEECTADCTDLECGPDPVCGFECGPCDNGFVCDQGLCVEDVPPMDSCEDNCGAYSEDALCNCDADCFDFGDCCDDICDFCEADYPEDCEVPCVPDCTGIECGADPVCGEECGPCDDGFECDAGACVEESNCDTICAGHCGEFAACDCGVCEDGYDCVESVCQLIGGDEDVITGLDTTVGPGPDTEPGGEDTTDGEGGGGSNGGCTTTDAPTPISGLLVLFALMGLAVIRKVHA